MAMAGKKLMGLRRGLKVLSLLSPKRQGMSFTELQQEMGELPSPTLSRLVKVLIDEGMVEKNAYTQRYVAGRDFVLLARTLLGSIPREEIIKPIIDDLAERTGESAAYFEPDGANVILREKNEHANSFHYMPILGRNIQYPHGFLQAILPFLPEAERVNYFTQSRNGNRLSQSQWRLRHRQIARDKLYIDDGESNPAAVRITAPVFLGLQGKVVGSIGVTLLKGRLEEEHLIRCQDLVALAGRQSTEKLTEHVEDPPTPSS